MLKMDNENVAKIFLVGDNFFGKSFRKSSESKMYAFCLSFTIKLLLFFYISLGSDYSKCSQDGRQQTCFVAVKGLSSNLRCKQLKGGSLTLNIFIDDMQLALLWVFT